MGEFTPILILMKIAITLLLVAACALAQDDVFPADSLSENALAPEEDLLSAVKELRRVSDGTAYHTHGERIEDHAVLIQKAKAYKHSFGARNALRAAIRALVSELTTGHNHDRSALSRERNAGHNAIRNALNRGKSTAGRYREKACPTKKAQVEAEAARNSAKGRMNAIKRRKVCNLSTSWFDMNIKGSAPKFGGELRNKWDKARADYLRKLNKYNAAVRAYNKAARAHAGAMAAFHATVKAEAANAHSACRNAHKAYEILKRDVASNVRTRKQVYIASKVITCYINNLSNNGGAKNCADRARRTNTSRWNINAPKMAACLSRDALHGQLGPMSWRPSKRNCHARHWNERIHKANERKGKERTNKERSSKERKSKERNSKERNSKEKKKKAAAKEKKKKANARGHDTGECRLVNKHGHITTNTGKGLLQTRRHGQWGYACDDSWNDQRYANNNVQVVCRAMGFAGGSLNDSGNCGKNGGVWHRSGFPAHMRSVMDRNCKKIRNQEFNSEELRCQSPSFTRYSQCANGNPNARLGQSFCSWSESIYITCTGGRRGGEGKVRLVNKNQQVVTSSGMGIMQTYRHGQWGYACDDSWNDQPYGNNNVQTACKSMGFRGGRLNDSGNCGKSGGVWHRSGFPSHLRSVMDRYCRKIRNQEFNSEEHTVDTTSAARATPTRDAARVSAPGRSRST